MIGYGGHVIPIPPGIPMRASFRTRILITIGCILLLSAGSIAYFAQNHAQRAVLDSADRHGIDLMNAVLLTIENEYRSLEFHRHITVERRKVSLKDVVIVAMSHLKELYGEVQRGKISESVARREALEQLRQLRYANGVGYFWVNDLSEPIPKVLMHPILPEQEDGRSAVDDKYYRATQGHEHLLVLIAKLIRRDQEGFVNYRWNKPTSQGVTEEQPKISYVRLFKPWNWVVGSGVYLDDIEAEVQQRLDEILVELKRTFSRVHVAQNGYMFIFDGQGNTLIHPDARGEFADHGFPNAGQFKRAAATPNVPIEYHWHHPRYAGAQHAKRAYVSYFKPLDWYIVSTMYLDDLAHSGYELRRDILMVSGLVLLVAAMVSYLFSYSLTRPLLLLTDVARRIEHSQDMDISVPICGASETRELGQVLQNMLASMKGLLHDKEAAMRAIEVSNNDLIAANKQLAREMVERQEAQQALENNEQKYRSLFELSYDAIVLADCDSHQILDSNHAAEEMFGYSHDEMQGMLPKDFSPINQADGSLSELKVSEKISRLIHEGHQFFEWTHKKRDGTLFQAEVHLTLIPLDGKQAMLAVVRDVTQRKYAEAALVNALADAESSRDKIDAILKAISDGLIVVDPLGRIILINQSAQDWLGLPEGETLNRQVATVLHDNDLSVLVGSILAGESLSRHCEVEVPIADQERNRLMAVQVTAVQNDDKEISGTLILLRDITRERELDQLKNEFISSAAHELNTPLTVIMGFAELLVNREYRQSITLEQQQEFLETIRNKGEVLTSIVDDLLKLEQLEFGQSIQLQYHCFDLQLDIMTLVKHYEKTYTDHRFIVMVEPCELWADQERVGQVLDNLLSNAVKFSPPQTRIHISLQMKNHQAVITVRDEGIGMEQKNIDKVFDKFFRIDGSTTSKGGLGLGLTVAKSIIDAHHGSIRVDSEVDRGTTVTLTLPCQNRGEEHD